MVCAMMPLLTMLSWRSLSSLSATLLRSSRIEKRRLKEDGVEWVGVGGVRDANNPPTMVRERVACDGSPVVGLFHRVGFVILDVSDPRVHKYPVSSGHPDLTKE